ncbi:MAG: RusA family crossover junction endodeoxyribonuclease [Elusimicrobiota bacterium]
MKIVIPEIPSSLNKIFAMHWAERQREKARWSDLIAWKILTQKLKPIKGQVKIKLVYYFKTKGSHDYDNYSGKFILDGLKGKVIKDDSQRIVTELTHEFHYDPENPRIEILIESIEQ